MIWAKVLNTSRHFEETMEGRKHLLTEADAKITAGLTSLNKMKFSLPEQEASIYAQWVSIQYLSIYLSWMNERRDRELTIDIPSFLYLLGNQSLQTGSIVSGVNWRRQR